MPKKDGAEVIEIIELPSNLESVYSEFILADERAMIYGTLEFRAFLQEIVVGTPRYIVAVNDNCILGALPFFEAVNPLLGKVINSLPWYGTYGGCLVPSESAVEVSQALLNRYDRIVNAPDLAFATLILSPRDNQNSEIYLASISPDVMDGRIGQITDLPEDGADIEVRLENVFSQTTRNQARKARKQGFDLVMADDDSAWRFLYETHVENMSAIGGQAKPWEHFVAMRKTIPFEWRRLMLAKHNGTPVAAMLLFCFNRTVEYITPVIKHEYRSMQPLSFLIWHGMINAVRSGFRWWNWGGTWVTQKSLHHFKAGWGAKDQPYTYLIHAKPHAIEVLKQDRQIFEKAFPYFFTYPYHLLG